MNYRALIARHYPTDSPLRRLLLLHSGQVCRRALDIARRHPELGADLALVEAGAMLHDIGIYLTSAPSIHCHGTAPYLMHGPLGAQLLRAEGHEALARICERHTGTGLTAADIRRLELPLPAGNAGRAHHLLRRPVPFEEPPPAFPHALGGGGARGPLRHGGAPHLPPLARRDGVNRPRRTPKSARRPQALPRKAPRSAVSPPKSARRP